MLGRRRSFTEKAWWSCRWVWLPRAVLLLCLLLVWVRAAGAQSVQVQTWTTEEGLPQNSVHALLQTADGYLWLATENGAARFNGLRFQRYSSANESAFGSDDVSSLAAGAGGELLLGTASGVVVLRDGVFRRVPGVAGAVLGMQAAGDGSIVVLTAEGLWRWFAGAAVPVRLSDGAAASALGAGAGGSVLAVAGTTLWRLRGAAVERVAVLPVAPEEVLEDSAHRVWVATASAVELLVPSHGWLEMGRRWQVGAELPGSRVESLSAWAGGVLAGTNRGAVLLRVDGAVQAMAAAQNNAVLSALVDREGDRWFGTDSGGLLEVRARPIGSVAALAGESVTAVAAGRNGAMWVGTREAGLLRFLAGREEPQDASRVFGPANHPALLTTSSGVVAVEHLASQVVLSLAADDAGGVWVGSPEGLDHVVGDRVVEHRTAADGLPDDLVRSLLPVPGGAAGGAVWVGTRRGAALLRAGRVERVLSAAEGLPSDAIGTMLQDRNGAVWIGTLAGLARWDGHALVRREAPGGARFAVSSLLQTADGVVWAGTASGLYVVQGTALLPVGGAELRSGIAAVLPDGIGNVWVRTAAGLLRAPETALRACAGKPVCGARVRLFGAADGMPSVELPTPGSPAAAGAGDGTLWFATRRGVARVDPRTAAGTTVAPGVAIEEALLDEEPVPLRPGIPVAAGRRRLAVRFAGLSLRSPGQVQYRYLLDGFDRDWSPWEAGTVAEYTNLPPGRFTLRVEARDAEGAVSPAAATVAVEVAAPVYRRWWFYALLLLLAAAVAYGLYWLRLRRVRRDFEAVLQERNRIAREIHDTLAQDFVAVSLQLEVTQQLLKVGATAAAEQQIDATRTLVRDGIQDARESIWAIRAGGAEESLPARMAAAVAKTPGAVLSTTGAYRALSPSHEREVMRIAKEAMGNAERHARATAIRVDLIYSEDAVVLRVSDDGAGFDVGAAVALTGHYGVRGMRERAAAMGARLLVKSAPGRGTCVELRLGSAGAREA